MKTKFSATLVAVSLGLSSNIAFANDIQAKSDTQRETSKQEAKVGKPSDKPIANFGTKEQRDLEAILSELNRQHANAPAIVKTSRDNSSLAMQSALIAKNSPTKKTTGDVVNDLTHTAANAINKFKQVGVASWYGRQFHGKKTASGERFDMNALTAAHRSLPLGCYVKVTNKDNGQSVVVKINDRGPFHGNRVLDLSYGAAKAIGITSKGMGNVTIERVDDPNTPQLAMNE